MKRILIVTAVFALAVTGYAIVNTTKRVPNVTDSTGAVTLPNGWRITPAGAHIQLPGDLPMKMHVSPDGSRLMVLTGGFHDHSLNVIDLKTRKLSSTLDVVKTWDGMAYDERTSTAFLSGGGPGKPTFPASILRFKVTSPMKEFIHKPILRVNFDGAKLNPAQPIAIDGLDEKDRFISGMALGPDGALYAINIQTDTLYRLSGPNFTQQASVKTAYHPYDVMFSPDGKSFAVSNWGDKSVSLFDTASFKETSRIPVGSHPNEMVWARDGRLFVADSGSNEVSIIVDGKVVETIRTSMDPRAPVGSTPDALALSANGTRLYVANADNNNVAVIDVHAKESRVLGFIPTGWYPTALAISPDGKQLYVGTGKGMGFRNNYPATTPFAQPGPDTGHMFDYIPAILTGHVSVVDVPNSQQLAAYTKQAKANVPTPGSYIDKPYAAKIDAEVFPKIKHIVYIIRENRTYDQVLGDLGIGNGDPKLTFFGEKVTPNAHALSRHFVTLDNLYCDGEVSEDGHQWSNAAYATDFNQKAWTNSYSTRSEPDYDERVMSSPAGYIWDACERKHLTYRTYGEMASFRSSPDSEPEVRAEGSLKGHVSTEFLAAKTRNARDPEKVAIFIKELHEAEKKGEWLNFMVMSLGEDHTQGLRAGAFTPSALVASNDQAIGQLVEAVSHSSFWKETAIFIIEDDAQNGPDHVDAHRTVALLASPWVKRHTVDSSMYSTSSMVRTMELILGLDPMTQFDAAATPMEFSFTTTPDFAPLDNIAPQIDLLTRNPPTGPGAVASQRLDFSDYDKADPDELNRILWDALKPGQPMPAPVRSARLR